MATAVKPDQNTVKLSADRDRMLLLAIEQMKQNPGFFFRPMKDAKGNAVQRLMSANASPLINLKPAEYEKLVEKNIIIGNLDAANGWILNPAIKIEAS